MIAIRGLVKRYRDFAAVDGIDLAVSAGEIYTVLGPNGAGKTTTIKCLVGLLHPSAGSVAVGGHDVTREPEQAKSLLGYVPDRPFLYEKLTGAEFIRFAGALYRCDPKALARRAGELLERFDLAGWDQELIETYSYGMRQKIVLVATFARDPRAFVIDEPMVGLDPRAAKRLRELLLEEARRGKAVLVSTHSIALAEQVADRIGIIAHGKLAAEGTMDEIRNRAVERIGGFDLEEVFLTLTREEAEEAPALDLAAAKDPV